MQLIRVSLHVPDMITRTGLIHLIQSQESLAILSWREARNSDLIVTVLDRLTSEAIGSMRRAAGANDRKPIIAIVDEVERADWETVLQSGLAGILPRRRVTRSDLLRLIMRTASGPMSPPPSTTDILADFEQAQSEESKTKGRHTDGLAPQEANILRLVGNGLSTAEIAQELQFSERTVKNILYAVTQRLKLRNRTHAVAFAIRNGWI